jgi:hypothetical protein
MIHHKPMISLDLPSAAVVFNQRSPVGRLVLDQFRHCLEPASMVIDKAGRGSLRLNRANPDIIN